MPKKRINLTISQDAYQKLQDRANVNCRSISEEVEFILKNITPASTQITPMPFTPISTPENPTGQSHTPTASTITTADGNIHKKHPLLWLQENNIDPNDTSYDTYERFKRAFPDINIHEFDNYQQSRRQ